MTDKSTEWVTVKLHEDVRNQARDDERTYTEIMQDGLDVDTASAEGESVDVERIADELKNELSMANEPGVTVDTQALIERLERIEAAASTVEERTGSIERQLEDMGGR